MQESHLFKGYALSLRQQEDDKEPSQKLPHSEQQEDTCTSQEQAACHGSLIAI